MLKRFARWLLKEEIKKLEDEVESCRSELKDSVNDYIRLSRSCRDEIGETKARLDASMKETGIGKLGKFQTCTVPESQNS